MVKRLRLRPFTAATRVRVPSGSPHLLPPYGGIAQPVERPPHTRKVTDSSSVVSTTKSIENESFRCFFLTFFVAFLAGISGKTKLLTILSTNGSNLRSFQGFSDVDNAPKGCYQMAAMAVTYRYFLVDIRCPPDVGKYAYIRGAFVYCPFLLGRFIFDVIVYCR